MASKPRTVIEIFKDYRGRRNALIRALTEDFDILYELCDPDKENLCLYGHPNEAWEVTLPAEEVPAELPEPTLGINFARDDLDTSGWLSLVAGYTDSWLLSVAFYLGARLNHSERQRLFSLINHIPTVFEVVKDWKPIKDKSTVASRSESQEITKIANETIRCGSCGGNYNAAKFWIGCDICECWFHGKCAMITSAQAERTKQYKCPSCSLRTDRP